jgi:NTE family protein
MIRTALVLAGRAAHGAYEVGVVLHLLKEVSRDLGREVPIDILSGTSVGAINASVLAAFADEPRARGLRLASHWTNLKMDDGLRPDARGLFDSIRSLFGGQPRTRETDQRRGGVLNPAGIERIVNRATPFHRIREHLRAGHLQAVTMSTTHVGTGRTVVFVEQGPDGPRYLSGDPTVVSVPTELRAEHALASAAIPRVFPAVRIGDEFYADGGLCQNVPLAPALRLGAEALIVISPRYVDPSPPHIVQSEEEREFPGPFHLLGKALNALLLDQVENLLFDGQFAAELIELGRKDARARHDELCALIGNVIETRAAA